MMTIKKVRWASQRGANTGINVMYLIWYVLSCPVCTVMLVVVGDL